MIEHDLLGQLEVFGLLRQKCRAAGGQEAWAKAHGIAPSVVSLTLHAHRKPGPAILAALGLAEVTRYVPVRASGAAKVRACSGKVRAA